MRCWRDTRRREALFGRAVALLNLRQRLEEAVACFDQAALCGLDRVETLVGKSAALAQLKRHGEAVVCLSEVVAMAPEEITVLGSLAYSRLQSLDWTDYGTLVSTLRRSLSSGGKSPTRCRCCRCWTPRS